VCARALIFWLILGGMRGGRCVCVCVWQSGRRMHVAERVGVSRMRVRAHLHTHTHTHTHTHLHISTAHTHTPLYERTCFLPALPRILPLSPLRACSIRWLLASLVCVCACVLWKWCVCMHRPYWVDFFTGFLHAAVIFSITLKHTFVCHPPPLDA
jgi:hypothetical protein